MLYRCLKEFEGFKVGDVIADCYAHWCLVKVGDAKNKTLYRHELYAWKDKEWHKFKNTDAVMELTKQEIIKLLPHMTWKIWQSEGSRLNSAGQRGFSFDVLNEPKKVGSKKPRLLPMYMCYDCMKEGNKFMPKKPKTEMNGKCIVCEQDKPLHYTQYAYPLDLRSKGFGFSIIMDRRNFLNNIYHLKKNYQVEEWWNLPLEKVD